jgi:hypothetical protein
MREADKHTVEKIHVETETNMEYYFILTLTTTRQVEILSRRYVTAFRPLQQLALVSQAPTTNWVENSVRFLPLKLVPEMRGVMGTQRQGELIVAVVVKGEVVLAATRPMWPPKTAFAEPAEPAQELPTLRNLQHSVVVVVGLVKARWLRKMKWICPGHSEH